MQLDSDDECADKGEGSEEGVSIRYPFAIELLIPSANFAEGTGNKTYSHDGIRIPIFGSHGGRKERKKWR
jgi:hypothetical protein